jgi:hypothetical protein
MQPADIQLQALIAQFQDPGFTNKIVRAMTRPLQQEIQRSYDISEKPTGQKFVPLKKPHGLPPVFGLRDNYRYSVVDNKISITALKDYAIYHDTGTKHMPARSPWPTGSSIPASWSARLNPILDRAISSYLQTGRPPVALPAEPPSMQRTTQGKGR